MEGILAILMIFGIPLSAIIGSYIIKYKKIQAGSITSEDKEKIEAVLRENKELKARLNNVETIVGEIDMDLLRLESHTKPELGAGKGMPK